VRRVPPNAKFQVEQPTTEVYYYRRRKFELPKMIIFTLLPDPVLFTIYNGFCFVLFVCWVPKSKDQMIQTVSFTVYSVCPSESTRKENRSLPLSFSSSRFLL
jgi:hypothetical protein